MSHSIEEAENLDRLAAGYYGIALAGSFVVAITLHWIQHLFDADTVRLHAFRVLYRPVKKAWTGISLGRVLILPQSFALVLSFIALNVGLTAWEMQWSNLADLGSRLGWLALVNMCLAIFLGLKNTPLSPLAGKAYSDLNAIHRVCGYVTVVEVILHACFFSSGLIRVHAMSVLRQPIVYCGAVAGVAMVIIALTANGIFRSRQYEVFYFIHILMVLIILITVGLHQPDIKTGSLVVVIVSASIWAVDRIWRACSWFYHGLNGYCTILPLPQGATKVMLSKAVRCRPGDHALLWIPGLSLLERHPFSIMSTEPVEFIVAARDGFTTRLHEAAIRDPGARYRASIEGPYGSTPAVNSFNKALLIAGGSGVTFALSLAQDWMAKCDTSDLSQMLHFVWVVRSASHLDWIPDQLRALRSHPRVNVILHVTGTRSESKALADGTSACDEDSPVDSPQLDEKDYNPFRDLEKGSAVEKTLTSPEIRPRSAQSHLRSFFHHGRPEIDLLLHRAMADVVAGDKVLVTGSGPTQLLADIRAATTSHITIRGPSIKLHLEEYEL